MKVILGKKRGTLIFSDGYLYLTFRKRPFLRKILWKIIPKPSVLFIAKAPIKTIQKRKEGQRDRLSKEMIRELYSIYQNGEAKNIIYLNTAKPLKGNLKIMMDNALKASIGDYFLYSKGR